MSTTSTTTISLDPAIRERLQRLADAQQRPAQQVMQEAIAEYVERREKHGELRDELTARWEEYARTGLHVGDEEARTWLARLAGGEQPPIPDPHG